ncbi:DUF4470 multi-domain protein [Pyrenophora teres f. maculata]|nr:DUF4470 multi-domain protein [Pyrenophora teres f. maculata]
MSAAPPHRFSRGLTGPCADRHKQILAANREFSNPPHSQLAVAAATLTGKMVPNTPDLSEFFNPHLCANTDRMVNGRISPCKQKATMVCSKCYLVQYCCKACRVANWKLHKPSCNSELLEESYLPRYAKENRLPYNGPPDLTGAGKWFFGLNQYLWGNMPALDVLNMDKNECKDSIMERDINLLFAASGDLRNVVKTVVGLPEDYAGNFVVVMNDENFAVTARNALLLLSAMHFEPETAVPIMIHLWYSVLLPLPIVRALQDYILPYVQDVCEKLESKATGSQQAKTFKFGHRSIRLVLKKEAWVRLSNMFMPLNQLSSHRAMQIRQATTCAPERIDFFDRALYNMLPGQRSGVWRFRQDGLLIPYGTSRKPFEYPNPTFFVEKDVWPMRDDADPLAGWSYNEYITHSKAAKNDVYGTFFNFLRSLFMEFCKQIHSVKIAFTLFDVDAVKLPSYLTDITFDRIEVSNVCDRGYIGASQTLEAFSPMLKAKTENPHATLIMLFLNAVDEAEIGMNPQTKVNSILLGMSRVRRFMPEASVNIINMILGVFDSHYLLQLPATDLAESITIGDAANFFRDFDGLFSTYLQRPVLQQSGSMEDFAQKHGVKIKAQHTIVKPWPCRLTDETTLAEFNIMRSGSLFGSQRYMEFEKLEENPDEATELSSLEQLSSK